MGFEIAVVKSITCGTRCADQSKWYKIKDSLEYPVASLLQMPQSIDVSRTNVGIHTSLSTQKVHECLPLFQRRRQGPAFGNHEPNAQHNTTTAEAVGLVELSGCHAGLCFAQIRGDLCLFIFSVAS